MIICGVAEEKGIVHHELENGCGCSENCYGQFTEDEIYSIRLLMLELQKPEKDMLLLGKLQVFANASDMFHHARKTTKTKCRRIAYQYSYDSRSVCKSAFCFLHYTGTKALKNLQHHLNETGAIPREHGNRGRLPHNAFSYEGDEKFANSIRA